MWHPCYGTVTSMTQHLGSKSEDLREAHLVVAGQEHVWQGRAVAAALQQLRHVVPAPGPESVLEKSQTADQSCNCAAQSGRRGHGFSNKGIGTCITEILRKLASLHVCHCIPLQGFICSGVARQRMQGEHAGQCVMGDRVESGYALM